jgi:hypothetical protein
MTFFSNEDVAKRLVVEMQSGVYTVSIPNESGSDTISQFMLHNPSRYRVYMHLNSSIKST